MALKHLLASLLLATQLALAHPGQEEHVYAHNALPLQRKSLAHCEREFSQPEFAKRTVETHGQELARLQRQLGVDVGERPKLHPRDYVSVSRIDHKSNKTVSAGMDLGTLFADSGACMLTPAVDQGPLYVKGEEIRKDIAGGEAGIKMTLAIQVVDYKTCKPVTDAYVDVWSCNATGIYVGVQGYPGMGDPNDSSILQRTTLRGIQPTDDHGIASFDSLFPGHYQGRATHIHAIVYLDAHPQQNNTLPPSARAAHIGQLYFDQPLITTIESLPPYNTNPMPLTPNVADYFFLQGANGDDPVARYALVGNDLSEGVFAWIRFGVDLGGDQEVDVSAWWTGEGGVMNPEGPVARLNGVGDGGGVGGGWGSWGCVEGAEEGKDANGDGDGDGNWGEKDEWVSGESDEEDGWESDDDWDEEEDECEGKECEDDDDEDE